MHPSSSTSNRPMPMLRPHWQTDTYILVKPTHQTHRSDGRIPQPCHATTNANHTQTDISATNAAKAPLPYEPRLASDKTHDANCRHQPMTRLDLRTFCNVRETVTVSDSDILYHSEPMHASSSSPALPLSCTVPYQHNTQCQRFAHTGKQTLTY